LPFKSSGVSSGDRKEKKKIICRISKNILFPIKVFFFVVGVGKNLWWGLQRNLIIVTVPNLDQFGYSSCSCSCCAVLCCAVLCCAVAWCDVM